MSVAQLYHGKHGSVGSWVIPRYIANLVCVDPPVDLVGKTKGKRPRKWSGKTGDWSNKPLGAAVSANVGGRGTQEGTEKPVLFYSIPTAQHTRGDDNSNFGARAGLWLGTSRSPAGSRPAATRSTLAYLHRSLPGQCLVVAVVMVFQLFSETIPVGRLRRKLFTRAFFKEHFPGLDPNRISGGRVHPPPKTGAGKTTKGLTCVPPSQGTLIAAADCTLPSFPMTTGSGTPPRHLTSCSSPPFWSFKADAERFPYRFNNAQRVHYNYLEGIPIVLVFEVRAHASANTPGCSLLELPPPRQSSSSVGGGSVLRSLRCPAGIRVHRRPLLLRPRLPFGRYAPPPPNAPAPKYPLMHGRGLR